MTGPDERPAVVLDATSALAPYEQVRRQLAGRIASGELVVGTRLPTVRRLAEDLGLAVNTVARAYRELEEAGVVETRGRAGTVVSSRGDHGRERAAEAARAYVAQARSWGIAPEEALRLVQAALDSE